MNQIACLAIIKNKNGEILAVEQVKSFGNVLFVPGGKLNEDESCRNCLKREIKEELGIDAEVKRLIACSETDYDGKEMLNLYYEAEIISGSPRILEREKHKTIKYVPFEEIYNFKIIKFLNK